MLKFYFFLQNDEVLMQLKTFNIEVLGKEISNILRYRQYIVDIIPHF